VTSLDYDHNSTLKLKLHHDSLLGGAVRGDASHLPFACDTFSSVLAILVLHHLKSTELQDQMFAEVFRVLRPGGIFVAFEITDGWIHQVAHIRSTFTPVPPASVLPRLTAAGFSNISLELRKGAFRLTAVRLNQAKHLDASVTALRQTG
jgi:ubiquinone/menaquinone biosynthesis C-methylase UbiE